MPPLAVYPSITALADDTDSGTGSPTCFRAERMRAIIWLFLAGGALSAPACDPQVPEHCLLPFPNDFYRSGSPARLAGLVW